METRQTNVTDTHPFLGLASMSLYGGLVLFSGFLLYDTQRLVRKAEVYPQYGYAPYDPINA